MNKKAFTLIELIVGISISMILMVSVGLFVNNGMANIITQQKVIKNTKDLTDFTSQIHSAINLLQSGSVFPIKTSSGILFKRNKNLGKGGFSYIGTTTSTTDSNGNGIYCESGSELTDTKHIFIKNFIPFEEKDEDIFNDYNSILTASGGTDYLSYQKENIIKKSGNIIIGKGIFGDKFENGASGKDIYLNSPTGIYKNGNILFISDTLNNRILYYEILEDKIYKLLDETDGLNEPTGLYYNNTEKALYIANSGNGEILKYSSKSISSAPNLNLSGFTENNINKIEVEFTGSILPNLNRTGDWNTTSSYSDSYKKYIDNKILYYSINKNSNKTIKANCDHNGEYLFKDSNDTNKPTFYCTESGTGKTLSHPTKNISNIKITNLSNFSNTGSYIVNLKLYNDSNKQYSKIFPYFTQSDDNILTPNDNTLEIVKSGLNYPTGLRWDSGIKYNEFGTSGRNFLNKTFSYNKSDSILKTPIDYLKTYINNGLVSLVLKYYKKFNCYNLDDKSERTYLFNKNLK